MSAVAESSPRTHWHQRATQLAVLDCHLLELLPWEQQALAKLPPATYQTLAVKLAEFVDWACKQGGRNVECAMAKSIWRFVKTLKPDLQPFADY